MLNMYLHGGSENHGCEAIIRSTIKMLEGKTRVYSNNIEQDTKYGLDQICELKADIPQSILRGSKEWFFSSLQTKLTGKINLAINTDIKNSMIKYQKGIFSYLLEEIIIVMRERMFWQQEIIICVKSNVIQCSGDAVSNQIC